jgi:hypothetical protein
MKECVIEALQKKKGGNCLRSYRSLEKATEVSLFEMAQVPANFCNLFEKSCVLA